MFIIKPLNVSVPLADNEPLNQKALPGVVMAVFVLPGGQAGIAGDLLILNIFALGLATPLTLTSRICTFTLVKISDGETENSVVKSRYVSVKDIFVLATEILSQQGGTQIGRSIVDVHFPSFQE